MLNRRNFLRTSGAAVLGLAALVNDSQAYPRFNSPQNVVNPNQLKQDFYNKRENKRKRAEQKYLREEAQCTRESMIFTYEEWKKIKEIPDPPEIDKELFDLRDAQKKLRPKIELILRHPEKAFSFLTDKEKESYKSELHMFDVEDIPLYCTELNIRYNLMNLELTPEIFEKNTGAKLLKFLDQYYSYRYSDENAGKKK